MLPTRKNTFKDVGVGKQETSKNETEALKNLRYSCSHCYKAGYCIEQKCAIYKAHQQKLLMLQFNRMPVSTETHFVKTRAYHITKTSMHHGQALKKIGRLELDNNSVSQLQQLFKSGNIEDCLIALLNIKLVNTAKEIAVLTKKKTWFEKLLKEVKT